METNKYTAKRLREVLLNGKWIANTNFREQISEVNWQDSIHKIGNLNTIAALTFHINYYVGGVLNVFYNGKLEIRDMYSFDLPPITSESDWKMLVDDFLSNAEKLAQQIENMPEAKFQEKFVDEKYGHYLRNIDGIIEHAYYHLGQIALIRKMISEKK